MLVLFFTMVLHNEIKELCGMLSIQPSEIKTWQLGEETLKKLLPKGIQDEYFEILNMMGTCDVFQLPYDEVCELGRRYSRGNSKIGKNPR